MILQYFFRFFVINIAIILDIAIHIVIAYFFKCIAINIAIILNIAIDIVIALLQYIATNNNSNIIVPTPVLQE